MNNVLIESEFLIHYESVICKQIINILWSNPEEKKNYFFIIFKLIASKIVLLHKYLLSFSRIISFFFLNLFFLLYLNTYFYLSRNIYTSFKKWQYLFHFFLVFNFVIVFVSNLPNSIFIHFRLSAPLWFFLIHIFKIIC